MVRSAGRSLFLDSHSSLLTKKNRSEKKDKTWEWAEEREVFREIQVNQEGPKEKESLIIGILLPGSQMDE